ncbi:uncharacterized protein isoform X2 [Leptinotarsa decemlineata]|uniref:uncharacterized protein isoform X2 n=1 Tax=Leptinotarsa decemlineata TaxID=7539 RepID=UPI003D30BA9B
MKIATLCVAIFLVATVSRTEGKPVPGFLGMLTDTLGILGNAVNGAEDMVKEPIDGVVKMDTTTTTTTTTRKPTTTVKLTVLGKSSRWVSNRLMEIVNPMINVINPFRRPKIFADRIVDKALDTFDHIWGTMMSTI